MSTVIKGLFIRIDAPTPDEPHAADFDGSDHAWFCRVLAWTEMASHHHEIEACACCRSTEICRMPMLCPELFGSMKARGARWGYALCVTCKDRTRKDARGVIDTIDANFAGVGAA